MRQKTVLHCHHGDVNKRDTSAGQRGFSIITDATDCIYDVAITFNVAS
jgi:hypothetical protein